MTRDCDRASTTSLAARAATLARALALCGFAVSTLAAAQSDNPDTSDAPYAVIPLSPVEAEVVPPPDRSGFLIAPFVWVPSIDGPVGAGTTRQDIDLSSGDLIDGAERGLMGYLRWTFGRQFVYFEGVDAAFQDDSFDSFFRQDVDAEIRFLEAGYGRDIRVQSAMLPRGHLWVSPYVGVRYAALDVSIGLVDPVQTFIENPAAILLALEQGVPMDVEDEIVDVALGLIVDLPLSRSWSLLLKLDGAGFSLDQSRYFNGAGLLRYAFSEQWSVLAGYRYAEIKAEAGQDNDLNVDWQLGGPLASVAFSF